MTCTTCSVEVPIGARFCHSCGNAVETADASGDLFDATRTASSDEEAEKIAWEILKPHLEEAKKTPSSMSLLKDGEWIARVTTRKPKGPVPELHAQTPFFSIVYAMVSGREQYEDIRLTDLEELARAYAIRISLLDRMPHDVEDWKVVIDPGGLRLKPNSQSPTHFEPMGDRYYHSVSWFFDADAVSKVAAPVTVALLRPGMDEVRYQFHDFMR